MLLEVSIIIISYNTKDLTISSIKSVYEQTVRTKFEILVVDNNSSDDSVETISRTFPDIRLFALDENIGFAKANNFAARYAKGKYHLLLNPDTIILDKGIDRIFLFAEKNPKYLVYGGRTFYEDLSLNPTSCWKKPTLWSFFCYATGLTSLFRSNVLFDPESYGKWQRDTIKTVDIVTGCFLLIRADLWKELEGFDEDFFMYGEDADLCFRARKAGAVPVITPEATLIHYGGASEKIRADKVMRLFRAKKQLIRKHWHPVRSVLGSWLLTCSAFTRYMALKMLLVVTGPGETGKKDIWGEVWRKREEW